MSLYSVMVIIQAIVGNSMSENHPLPLFIYVLEVVVPSIIKNAA